MLKKATRIGQKHRIPLVCDPEFPDVDADRLSLFAESLDAAALGDVDLSGITHVVIRGLSGPEFADCQMAAIGAADEKAAGLRVSEAIAKAGTVSVDGLDDLREAGPFYLSLVMELAVRIRAWSMLGESVGSSCAPSHDGPT